MKRQAISKKTRFEVFKRDGFICQYCGSHPPKVILHVHIIAVANGGLGDMDNLVTSCESCNQGKAARPLTDVPKSLREKSIETQEREDQLRGYADIMEAKRERIEGEVWRIAEVLKPGCSDDGINRDYLRSIRRFLGKLDCYEVLDAMEIATSKIPRSHYGAFKYFCGVCWRKIERANGQNPNSET